MKFSKATLSIFSVFLICQLGSSLAYADDGSENPNGGKVLVYGLREKLPNGNIVLKACELSADKTENCVLAGRASGYSETQLNQRSYDLQQKAQRADRISTLSQISGVAIGVLGGGGLGMKLAQFEDDRFEVNTFTVVFGGGLGGGAGGLLGWGGGILAGSAINSAKKLDSDRDSSAATAVNNIEKVAVNMTRSQLKDQLNYALFGITDDVSDSHSTQIANGQKSGGAAVATSASAPIGASGALVAR